MSTSTGAKGLWRGALRVARFGPAAALGVLAFGLAGSAAPPSSDQVVLAGYGTSGTTFANGSQSSPATPQAASDVSFRIAGSVGGLYPGAKRSLVLTVTNLQVFPIVVTSLRTAVRNASARCIGSNLSVSAFSGHLSVRAHGSAKTSVLVSLVPSAPNSCTGAAFPLVYSVLGEKA
jgi:hypothetical protein